MKFGGAAVADAAGIRRVVALVQAERARAPVVVVSALAGATDALLAAADAAAAGAGEPAVAALVARPRAGGGERGLPPAGSGARQTRRIRHPGTATRRARRPGPGWR
jgi:hypothetical protein